MRIALAFLVMALIALGLAACGERGQLAQGERSYQGKTDTKAWDNDGAWAKGDRASWETHMKARQLTQHEHKRIYQ